MGKGVIGTGWRAPAQLRAPHFDLADYLIRDEEETNQTAWEKANGLSYHAYLGFPEQDLPGFNAPDPEWVEMFCKRALDNAVISETGQYPASIVSIPVGALSVAAYERDPDDPKGKRLLSRIRREGFDSDIVGTLTLNYRNMPDGTPVISVMDGRGRGTYLLRTYGPDVTALAVLYFGIPREGENKFYEAQKDSLSRRLTVVDLLRSQIDAKNPNAMEMLDIIDSLGLTINLDGSKNMNGNPSNNISAVSEVQATYNRGGADLLMATLSVLKDAYGDAPNTYSTNIVGGVSEFLRLYTNQPAFRRDRLIKALVGFKTPKNLEQVAFASQAGRSRVKTVGPAILDRYNLRLGELNRLPNWDAALYLAKQSGIEKARAERDANKEARKAERKAEKERQSQGD